MGGGLRLPGQNFVDVKGDIGCESVMCFAVGGVEDLSRTGGQPVRRPGGPQYIRKHRIAPGGDPWNYANRGGWGSRGKDRVGRRRVRRKCVTDILNSYERSRLATYFGNGFEAPPAGPMPLNAPFNEGAQRFQAPAAQEAIRPRQ